MSARRDRPGRRDRPTGGGDRRAGGGDRRAGDGPPGGAGRQPGRADRSQRGDRQPRGDRQGPTDRSPRGDRSPGADRGPGPGARTPGPKPGPPPAALYGRNPIREALRARRRRVHRVWATASAAREPWLTGAPVEIVAADEITARARTDAHQGMCADAGPYPYVDESVLLSGESPLIVALDEVQDPQNVGAIARAAECAGASGLVLPRHRSAEVTAAVCKASAGAVEHLPIAQVRNIADFLGAAKEAGCWVYGADAGGQDYAEPDYRGGVVLVLGAEGRGLRPRVRATCDGLIAIPMHGRIDSLNVSTAAAVLLYGVLRAR